MQTFLFFESVHKKHSGIMFYSYTHVYLVAINE